MALHPKVLQACAEIDADIFSGEAGGVEGRKQLLEYIARWQKELESQTEVERNAAQDAED